MASSPSHEPSLAPRVAIVRAQLPHIVAHQVEAQLAEDLVDVVVREHGVVLPGHPRDAAEDEPRVSSNQLLPGRLVFGSTASSSGRRRAGCIRRRLRLESAHRRFPSWFQTRYQTQTGGPKVLRKVTLFETRGARGLGTKARASSHNVRRSCGATDSAGAESVTRRHNEPHARVIRRSGNQIACCGVLLSGAGVSRVPAIVTRAHRPRRAMRARRRSSSDACARRPAPAPSTA